MATNDKTTSATPPFKTIETKPSLSDTQARDQFIGIALRELIAKHVGEWKLNYNEAATHAVRYANAVMVARAAETAPLKVVVSKGTVAAVDMGFPNADKTVGAIVEDGKTTPAKSIAEIIGEAEPVAEIK